MISPIFEPQADEKIKKAYQQIKQVFFRCQAADIFLLFSPFL